MKNDDASSINEAESASPPDSSHQGREGHHRQRRHQHESRPLKIRRVPMRYGWYWLIEGFILWTRNPAFLSFLALCCGVGIIVAALPPYVNELLPYVLYPGLMLGVFNGCRAIDRKRRLSPGLLFTGFRRYAFDLLLAGFCCFLLIEAVLFSTRLIDDGMLWRWLFEAEVPDMALSSPPLLYSLLFTAILWVLWGVVYLFVPQLIGWWRLSVLNALIFSLKGCLINFLPFLAYAFCYGFFIIILPAIVINFLELTVKGLGVVACVVFLLVSIPTLIASFYVAARDIYGFPRRRKHKKRRPDPALSEREKLKA